MDQFTPPHDVTVAAPGKVVRIFHAAADAVERWMIDSGALEQLAFLATKTSLVRLGIVSLASTLLGAGVIQGSTAEVLIGVGVNIAVGTLTAFISRVRNKYGVQTQAIVGARQDHFVGPQTIAQIADLATVAALAATASKTPPVSAPTSNP